jgi:hypothetical protein
LNGPPYHEIHVHNFRAGMLGTKRASKTVLTIDSVFEQGGSFSEYWLLYNIRILNHNALVIHVETDKNIASRRNKYQ